MHFLLEDPPDSVQQEIENLTETKEEITITLYSKKDSMRKDLISALSMTGCTKKTGRAPAGAMERNISKAIEKLGKGKKKGDK